MATALPLDVVLNGPRPGPGAAAVDQVWLELRAEVRRLCDGHREFDPRRLLELAAADDRALWDERRRDYLAGKLAGDPRVLTA